MTKKAAQARKKVKVYTVEVKFTERGSAPYCPVFIYGMCGKTNKPCSDKDCPLPDKENG